MKFYQNLLIIALSAVFTSCFKEEPLNAECDILEASVSVSKPEDMFYHSSDSKLQVPYTDSIIIFSVRRHADLNSIAPHFTLTDGATIVPANGSVQDFSKGPVIYTVTSEDKQWNRHYAVSFFPVVQTVSDTIRFDFEHYELEQKELKYYTWYDIGEDGQRHDYWATGNSGFRMSGVSAPPEGYPSVPVKDGHSGSYAKLTTKSTGLIGSLVGKPLAAGNLYLGSFDLGMAVYDAMKATKFGIPFDKKPIKLTGWYRYKPGIKYQDKKRKIVPNRTDSAAIYAVFYRNVDEQDNPVTLYGDDVLTNKHILAIAKVAEVKTTDQWTPFEVVFDYTQQPDERILANRGYNLTIVFSSSERGAQFEGAIGSELSIDEVRIICTKEE
ncbi:putative glycoside hydrolase xylanase [Prevotella sp. BV3P1]|uniref:PCMD domain-containing protein n=1 Tax=Prevotella sp. BV3P1 TaxID=1111130 RepID=UPI0003B8E4B9|nr:PCMD domain-containing protein [Prevotella sp. BV3P1]ERT60083.1 putative glycoside hydrolase xylanase [Prevotella sp. BV3P1]